ncbi:MAG: cytochrome C oxidase subunit IV family protein [Chitinophagales bacterium]|nr:cytochrome C oxidase subunit IV family protein [Chitinophagales bacterium]
MEYTTTPPSQAQYEAAKKEIIKVTWVLSVLTVIELMLGFWLYKSPEMSEGMRWAVKGVIIILMLAKAFYIVAYFMHLKHELKNFIMTIVLPIISFIWIVFSFLHDGNSYKELRNDYNPHPHTKVQKTTTPAHGVEGKK